MFIFEHRKMNSKDTKTFIIKKLVLIVTNGFFRIPTFIKSIKSFRIYRIKESY